MITTKSSASTNDVEAPPSVSNQGTVVEKTLLGFDRRMRNRTLRMSDSYLKNNIKYKKLEFVPRFNKVMAPAYSHIHNIAPTPCDGDEDEKFKNKKNLQKNKKEIMSKNKNNNNNKPIDIVHLRQSVDYDMIKQQNMLLMLLRDMRPENQPQLISYSFVVNNRLCTRGAKMQRKLIRESCDLPLQTEPKSDFDVTDLPRQSVDVQNLVTNTLREHDFYIKFGEDIGTFMFYFTNASSTSERLVAISTFLKLRISGSLLNAVSSRVIAYYYELFGTSQLQSLDDAFSQLRFYLDGYNNVKSLPIFVKLQRLLMYCLSLSLFEPLGITFSRLQYDEVEAELIKKKYHLGPDFFHCLCDSVLFLCERGYQAFKVGRLDPIFHSASSYETWFSQTKMVIDQSKQLNNPALHGFSEESYLGDLDKLIEQGDAIKRYATMLNHFEQKSICYYLGELKLAKANHLTLAKACSIRPCPFGILLFGDSGIGKSTIVDILYLQYAKYFNLPSGPEYRYPRHPSSKHWNNFRSQMWCLIYDELGFMNPDCPNQGEGSIVEILQIMNYVPFCPEQAALEDKGKTPFLGRLVISTTNTKNFNASHYFATPSAAQRRLPFVVTITVKDDFSDNGRLDTSKTHQDPQCYPDYWNFKVEKVLTRSVLNPVAGQSRNAAYELIGNFTDIHRFLSWYNSAIQQHHDNQTLIDKSLNLMRDITFCKKCVLPQVKCECPLGMEDDISLQSRDECCYFRLLSRNPCVHCGCKDCAYASSFDDVIGACCACGRCRIQEGCYYCECLDFGCIECGESEAIDVCIDSRVYYVCRPSLLQSDDEQHLVPQTPLVPYYSPSDPFPDVPTPPPTSESAVGWWERFCQNLRHEIKRSLVHLFVRVVGWLIGLNLALTCPDWISFVVIRATSSFLMLIQVFAWLAVGDSLVRDPIWVRASLRLSGYLTQNNYRTPKIIFGVGIGIGIIFGLKRIWGRNFPTKQSLDTETHVSFKEPKEKGSPKPDVYHCQSPVLQPFDYGRVIPSQSGLSLEEYRDVLSKNLGVMSIKHSNGKRYQRVICLVDNIYLLNFHAIRDLKGQFDIEVLMVRHKGMPECIYKMKVTKASFYHHSGTDLAAIRILQSPPRRSIIDLFFPNEQRINRSAGEYLTKQLDGSVLHTPVNIILEPRDIYSSDLGHNFVACEGETPGGLKVGDCGSILVAFDGKMRCIVGMHTLGMHGNKKTFAQFLHRALIESMLEKFSVTTQCADPIMECSLRSVKLKNLHEKSVFRYIPDGYAQIYGSTDAVRGKLVSTVEPTIICDSLLRRGYELNHVAPPLQGYKIWRVAALDMLYPPEGFDMEALEVCAKSFCADIFSLLPRDELQLLEPYTYDVAINGSAGVKFVDKIKRSTSAGFPRFQSKRLFLLDINSGDANDDRVEPTPEIKEEFEKLHANALEGRRNHVVFVCTPKDEPISREKFALNKVRIFSGSPFAFTILMRMYFLSSCRVIMRNRFAFESMVGTIAQSSEWSDLYSYLTQFGKDNIAAGDFKKFDKTTLCGILYLCFKVLIRLNMESGNFCLKQQRAMWSIAYDVIYAVYYFNGDLVTFMNGNPSGHVLTVIINCFVNSIYMRYVFMHGHPLKAVEQFRSNVALATYGDDNVMNIHPRVVHWFNHTTISQVLAECGITYTMPDKKAESIPIVNIDTVDFLKRKWRYEESVSGFVAPLDPKSIFKSLMIWNRSKTISAQDQIIEIMSSAIRESFFHGRVFYDEINMLCREIIDENNLTSYIRPHTFTSWEDCVGDYLALSECVVPISKKFLALETFEPVYYDMDLPIQSTGPVEKGPLNQNSPQPISDCPLQIDLKTQSGEWDCLMISPGRSPKSLFREDDKHGRSLSKIRSVGKIESSPRINNRLAQTTINTHDDPLRSVGITNNTTEQINVGIMDTNANKVVNQGSRLDDSFLTLHNPDVELDSYLRRPVLIKTIDWTTSSAPTSTPFYPWHLYFNNTAIKKKLDNYALMSCNLHIKVVISSTPFLYGNTRLTYRPLQVWNENNIISTIGYDGDKVGYSQRPYIEINPQYNTGGDMILPFFYPRDWFEIGEADNLTNMGEMKFITFADLVSANGASTESVTIQIFAWAENIKLAAPTVSLSMQSSDEYSDLGPISGPASAISQAAGSLTKVPIIGRYATATSMAMSGVSAIAKAFGYTNVPNTVSASAFKNVPFSHITSPEISGPVEKLTLDPKNELSIDSSIVGIDEKDPLSIESFVQRESWIFSTTWLDTDSVDDRLFSTRVTPLLLRVDGSSNYRYQMTPMSLLAHMFSYWRGDIIFKFKIICSRYHRGKLRVSWDPYGDINGTADSVTTVYNRIVDIANENEFEICVPYKQSTQWQNASTTLQENFVGSGTLVRESSYDNGVLVLRVFNKQSAPASSAITILVSARGAPNLEFSAPRDISRSFSLFPVQSSDVKEDDQNLSVAQYATGVNQLPHPSRYLICQGESVQSLRQLLRRSCYNYTSANGSSGATYMHQISEFILPRQPLFYGYDPGSTGITAPGVLVPGSTFTCNFANNVPYHLIVPCFVGMRGSFNWHLNFDNDALSSTIVVERTKQASTTIAVAATAIAGASTHSQIDHFNWLRRSGMNGGAILTNQKTQTGMSVQAPMYSRFRMIPTSPYSMWASTDGSENHLDKLRVKVILHPNATGANTSADNSALQMYCCIGTDFNVFYFLNVPTFYSYTLPTP